MVRRRRGTVYMCIWVSNADTGGQGREGRERQRDGGRRRTIFDETTPLTLPKVVTIAIVRLRLYEPSTLFDTQTMILGLAG